MNERFSARSDIGIYQLRADQRLSQQPTGHLSFSTTNFSASVGGEWDLRSIDYNQHNIIYVLGELGVTKLSPAVEVDGIAYSLPDFATEGKPYASWVGQFSYGAGIPFMLSASTQLRLESRYTHVLSDYLDDVSSRYADKSASSVLEKRLADRGIDFSLAPKIAGAQRGNPKRNDGYILITLQLICKLR